MKVICGDKKQKSHASAPEERTVSSVVADINRLLSPKSYEELEKLEVQIRRKLNSNEPIDTDYWEHLLKSLTVWKARAKLRRVYQAVINGRVEGFKKQQQQEAETIQRKLAPLAPLLQPGSAEGDSESKINADLDPEPLLQLPPQDKGLEIMDEEAFLGQVVCVVFSVVKRAKAVPYLIWDTGCRAQKGHENGIRPVTSTPCR